MSEQGISTTASGGEATSQGTASPSKGSSQSFGGKSGTQNPASAGHQRGLSGSSKSVDAESSRAGDLSQNGGKSDKPLPDLPDELDLDTLDEETLKKLNRWKKKIKIDGQERIVPLSEFIRYSQKEFAADKRMNEANLTRKEKAELEELLRTNPAAALEKYGHNVDELAKSRINQKIEWEMMSPEQKEAYLAKREAEDYKNRLLAHERAKAEAEEAEYRTRSSETWQKQIVGALEKSGLPKDPLVLKLTAQFVLANRKAGFKDFTADDAIPMVKDFCTQMARYWMKSMPMPDLFKALGDDWDSSVRKHLLSQAQNPIKEGFKQTPQGQQKKNSDNAKPKYMTADQWKAHIDKKFG